MSNGTSASIIDVIPPIIALGVLDRALRIGQPKKKKKKKKKRRKK